jgi:hypothetical protein
MSNLRTWAIPVADIAAYTKGTTLMDAVPRLADEAREWQSVEITNNTDDTAYVALMGGAVDGGTFPADDETSVTIAAGESCFFSSVDFSKAHFKGEGATGSLEIVGSVG